MTSIKLLPTFTQRPVKVLFVCLGNICRSPAAEGVMLEVLKRKDLQNFYEVDSAGTYGGHAGELPDRRMRIHAQRRGYNLTHRSRMVTLGDIEYFDLIVAMDDSNLQHLRQMATTVEESRKIVRMADFIRFYSEYDYVPDPYYEGAEGFEIVLNLLEDACECLVNTIEYMSKFN